jgi:hypothetical protein
MQLSVTNIDPRQFLFAFKSLHLAVLYKKTVIRASPVAKKISLRPLPAIFLSIFI